MWQPISQIGLSSVLPLIGFIMQISGTPNQSKRPPSHAALLRALRTWHPPLAPTRVSLPAPALLPQKAQRPHPLDFAPARAARAAPPATAQGTYPGSAAGVQ